MKRCWEVLTTVLLFTRFADAAPAAEKLFRDGRALLEAGKLAEACDAFERSDALEPRVGTMLNLADCRERQGRTATAWALFLEAKARAAKTRDQRVETATERAAKLEPKLSYMTIRTERVDGLVITRDGETVSSTVWNMAVPLDPADYKIEARAPGHKPWSTKQALKDLDRVTVTIGPLVAESAATAQEPPVEVAAAEPTAIEAEREEEVPPPVVRDPIATRYHLGVGLAIGVAAGQTSSSPPQNEDALEDDNLPVGLRLLGSVSVPRGAVRAIGSVLYTKGLNDGSDPSNTKKLYVLGLAADYVYMPLPQIAFAVGLGVGWDYEVRAFDGGTDLSRWETLRASPLIYRMMDGRVELGAHAQLIRRGDEVGFIGLAAVDVFLL